MKSYIVIFKEDAPKSAIDDQIKQIESNGGSITHRYDSDIMRGFAAKVEDKHADQLKVSTEGGAHEHM